MDLRQENRHLRNVKWNNEREIYRLTNKLRETEYLLKKERRAHMDIGTAIKSLEEARKVQDLQLRQPRRRHQYNCNKHDFSHSISPYRLF